jgi:DNA helicase-2/ATP-dependent DNA helicase PcrA
MSEEIFLNKEQIEAVNTIEGNLLILASAGTGKTTTIVERYVNMVENHGFNPSEIMMTTFTNKAAKDMVKKISKRTNKIPQFMGTMHSLFLKIIRDNAELLSINPNFTLLTEDNDKKKIIKEILLKKEIKPEANNVQYLLNRIAKFKNVGIKAESISEEGLNLEEEKLIEEEIEGGEFITVHSSIKNISNSVYKEYQNFLKEMNQLDFDDILLYMYILLNENESVKKQYQNKFRAIMVDEAQDLNVVQRNILELLQDNNLCLIGDDCQNIYSWRGSSNELIFNFDEVHNKIILKDNYRSSEEIISNVNKIIDSITLKIDKQLNCTKGIGEKIRIKGFYELKDELMFSVFEIKKLLENKESPGEIAVLFRINRIGKQIERLFRKNKIPCHLSRSKGFFEREEIKDILAFVKLKINPNSLFDFERLLSLIEGVGKQKIEQLMCIARENRKSLVDSLGYFDKISANDLVKERLSRLYSLFRNKNNNPVEEFISFFDYENNMEKKYHSDAEKVYDKIENLNVLRELIKDYEFSELGIRDFLDELIDIERKEKDDNKIILTTIHSAKGLEWKHVYLVGCNDKILPSYGKDLSKIKRDDELRLFYVAVSRAKDFLTITHSEKHDYRDLDPSQFLEIIDGDFDDELNRVNGLEEGEWV